MARKGRGGRRVPSAGEPRVQRTEWPQVLIAIPTERTVMVEAMDGIVGVAMRAALHGWAVLQFSYRRTDLARNIAAHHLLDSPATYLAMLDSDHRHEPEVVEKLVSCAIRFPELDIVAGLNYRRALPHEPMAYKWAEGGGMSVITNYREPGLIMVDAVATPAIVIHRRVFERLEPPWFTYGYEMYRKGQSGSEDIAFCRRLQREGPFKIAVHTQITSPHIVYGEVADASRYEAWLETAPRNAEGKTVWPPEETA